MISQHKLHVCRNPTPIFHGDFRLSASEIHFTMDFCFTRPKTHMDVMGSIGLKE